MASRLFCSESFFGAPFNSLKFLWCHFFFNSRIICFFLLNNILLCKCTMLLHFWLFILLIILTSVRGNLNTVLICISLKIKDVNISLIFFSHIIISVEKSLLKSVPHFYLDYLFLISYFLSSFYILDISTWSDMQMVKKISCHSVRCDPVKICCPLP